MTGSEKSALLRLVAPGPEPGTTAIVLTGPGRIGPEDIPRLCARLDELLADLDPGPGPVTLDVAVLREPRPATVEALARLQLTARRLGHRLRLRQVDGAVQGLLTLTGLDVALGAVPAAASGRQAGGQPEEREQPGGVEEGVQPGDPAG